MACSPTSSLLGVAQRTATEFGTRNIIVRVKLKWIRYYETQARAGTLLFFQASRIILVQSRQKMPIKKEDHRRVGDRLGSKNHFDSVLISYWRHFKWEEGNISFTMIGIIICSMWLMMESVDGGRQSSSMSILVCGGCGEGQKASNSRSDVDRTPPLHTTCTRVYKQYQATVRHFVSGKRQ